MQIQQYDNCHILQFYAFYHCGFLNHALPAGIFRPVHRKRRFFQMPVQTEPDPLPPIESGNTNVKKEQLSSILMKRFSVPY